MQHHRVPKLTDSGSSFVVRVAMNEEEISKANRLVFRNYVKDGFWENDEAQLHQNRFLHSTERTIFVVLEEGKLIGTMSIIRDSLGGLPSDGTQSAPLHTLRSIGQSLAEVSAFAMDQAECSRRNIVFFLISYMFQYSFYYAGIDRLVASCKPAHADFYESFLGFSKVTELTYYDYSHASGYLISLDLFDAHRLFSEMYPPTTPSGRNLYRFLLCDPQPCHQFPMAALKRSRQVNWAERGVRKVA